MSPTLLDKWAVPYVKVVQHPREFMVVYPGTANVHAPCSPP